MNERRCPKHSFRLQIAVLAVSLVAAVPMLAQPPSELFFSEYVEGSSLNKAVEIFNGTGGAVDLAAGGYDVQIYFNGSASAGQTISLTGTVADGDVYVLANSSATAAVLATADQISGGVSFNGDDAVALRKGGLVVDSLGQVGFDPGSEWTGGGIGTQNETLRRKIGVCAGDAVETDAFDPSLEWDGLAQDVFDGLGSHLQTCTGPVVPTASALLLTEVVVTPTAGEYVEIHNPTGAAVDLSFYYLTDATFAGGGVYYFNIVTGSDAGGGGFSDFHARFPDGATIAPGEYQTVSLAGSDDFVSTYGLLPTYELYEDNVSADGVADMREALPGSIDVPDSGLSNSGEVVVLYFWDGDSDLVTDVDYALWGDKIEAVDKSGVAIDGPDADGAVTTYQADTVIALQDVIATGGHAFGAAFQRIDFSEGTETEVGGNGVGGNDETSENLSVTWSSDDVATPGGPAPADWVINEIHADPAGDLSGDANGDGVRDSGDDEFVEIVNNTGGAVDISGWTLSDGVGVRHVFPNGTVVADQCSVVVFGGGTPSGAFGNGVVQTASSGALGLNNGGDSVALNDGASERASSIYGSEGGDNQSLTLDPDIIGTLPYVKHTLATGSGGALFSPGTRVDGSGFGGCPTPWVINEIHADPDSTAGDANGDGTSNFSQDEFVEIVNNSGGDVDISGWTLADGFTVRHIFPDGSVVLEGCSVVVFGGGAPSGAFGNSLVQTASGGSLGLNNGGDNLTLNDGASDIAMASYGGEGGDNQSLTLDPDVLGFPPYVKHTLATGSGGALFSPGTRIDGAQFAGCPVSAEIYEIQGAGASSPLAGSLVSTDADVVTALAPDGFFMQTPAAGSDGDADTSDGIFVFTGGAPTDDAGNPLAVGDLVDVTGDVQEFFGFTEFGFGSSVIVVGSGPVPPAVAFDATVPSPDPLAPSCALEYECYEGMLVEVAEGTVTGPNQRFGTDPIAEVHIVARDERAFREPGIEFPGIPGYPEWDGNPEVFELDPDKLGLPNQIIPAGSSFGASGVVGFEFGGYEIWPSSLTVVPAPLPVAVRARQPGELTVGTLNLFRLFDDSDDPADGDRDDAVVSTAEYQRRLAKFSAYIREVLDSPDILAVQEAEKLGVLEDLAALIEAEDASVVYSAHLVEGNDVGTIDVGFLVRDHITVDAVTQLGKDETFVNPITLQDDILHDRPPLLLEGSSQLEFGSYPIAVMTVHNRSLGGIDGSEGLRVRVKRLRQAESIADKVQALQTADPGVRLIVLGDFNAFEFTDGYVDAVGVIAGDFDPAESLVCSEAVCLGDLVTPDLENRVLGIQAAERYSFIFGGSGQVLDHALTSVGLAAEVAGAEYGRGNADAAVDLINDDGSVEPANLPLRSSDHDGLVVYVTKDEDADGVPNDDDACPGTVIPESVPTLRLGTNRWALVDDDGIFDTKPPIGGGPGFSFTLGDTAGCSCEQIIAVQGLGVGHSKFGCSAGEMEEWVELVNP